MNITSIIFACITTVVLLGGIWLFNSGTIPALTGGTDTIACTMEALECPDGSYVGRTGPLCEFSACPDESTPTSPVEPIDAPDNQVMCTMDVRECADGSYVGRVAPSCAFAACPDGRQPLDPIVVDAAETMCTPVMKNADACIEIYAPVCATLRVECVNAPCEPIQQTFSNGCFACIEDRVLSYTDGACAGDAASL